MRGDEAERARLLETETGIVGRNALDHDDRLACVFGAAERVPDHLDANHLCDHGLVRVALGTDDDNLGHARATGYELDRFDRETHDGSVVMGRWRRLDGNAS